MSGALTVEASQPRRPTLLRGVRGFCSGDGAGWVADATRVTTGPAGFDHAPELFFASVRGVPRPALTTSFTAAERALSEAERTTRSAVPLGAGVSASGDFGTGSSVVGRCLGRSRSKPASPAAPRYSEVCEVFVPAMARVGLPMRRA